MQRKLDGQIREGRLPRFANHQQTKYLHASLPTRWEGEIHVADEKAARSPQGQASPSRNRWHNDFPQRTDRSSTKRGTYFLCQFSASHF
ncbi:hypothetical protein CDAR_570701 [Caerostris darwini]|uniref:Uncharacterized protein n=1 Tax=Caerostris darwini TaxID=1538125 RepID=A0AAV4QGK5_9ARAC|nr:hypothetical protein CDAR_570701 [Caerostris darwini]